MQFFYGFFHANALLKISMNVKTKAITAMKMQTVQTLTAPSIVAVILDFLEMDSHAQVSNSKEFLHETECTIKHSLELLPFQSATKIYVNPRTYNGGRGVGVFATPLTVFLIFFLDDKTSAPEISFIPRAHLRQV